MIVRVAPLACSARSLYRREYGVGSLKQLLSLVALF